MKTRILANTFVETNKKELITFGGWDGTGYNGEGKMMKLWTSEKFPNDKFICKWMSCYQAWCILKVTDFKHKESGLPEVQYFIDFGKDEMREAN